MEAAAIVLLAAGALFGWQPMPDGNPGYEYVVQLEPELLATLQAGSSIPIAGDVPEAIGPIRRVRIVVGRGEVPRQRLTTALKPLAAVAKKDVAKKEVAKTQVVGQRSRERVVETQFKVQPVEPTLPDRYADASTNSEVVLSPSSVALPAPETTAHDLFGASMIDQPVDTNLDVKIESQTVENQTTGSSPAPFFPLVLSWVLLSGSGVGNAYLLWSYFDVRNKYRDLADDLRRERE